MVIESGDVDERWERFGGGVDAVKSFKLEVVSVNKWKIQISRTPAFTDLSMSISDNA